MHFIIFRRDLRLEDNTGLLYALENAREVLPAFIFTPEQIELNEYRSDHALQFMMESLEDVNDALKERDAKLYLFYGSPTEITQKVFVEQNFSKEKIMKRSVFFALSASYEKFLRNPIEQVERK